MRRTLIVSLFLLALASQNLGASVITSVLPEFNGNGYGVGDPYPLPAVTVGTFTYTIPPGEWIIAATISSTFGNSETGSTAGVDYYLDGLMVAQCLPHAACWTGPGPNPWAYVFSPAEFGLLADGSADLTAVQTNEYAIRLGVSTLEITTASGVIPEPVTLLLLGAGLVGLALLRRVQK
jgi:hypothetical protein